METLKRFLAEHPFFSGFDPSHLAQIAGCATTKRFNAGDFVFHEGQPADNFYIIHQGKIALQIHDWQPIPVSTIRDGEVLGWSWFLPPYRWHFDAQALTFTRALALDGKCLREKCEHDPKLGYELFKRVAGVMMQRLQSTRLQLLDMYNVHL